MDTSKQDSKPMSGLKINMNLVKSDLLLQTSSSPLLSHKPVLVPNLPGFKQKPMRRNPNVVKAISAMNSPSSANQRFMTSSLGLFPVKDGGFGQIGVPSMQATAEKLSAFSKILKKKPTFVKSVEREPIPSEVEIPSPKRANNKLKSIVKALELIKPQDNPLNILFKKLQTGRISIENVAEQDLIKLAIHVVQKPKELRGATDDLVLSRCVQVIPFFKEVETKLLEKMARTFTYIPLKARETVFNIGEIGTSFWIILKGSVEIIENKLENGDRVPENPKIQTAVSAFGEKVLTEKRIRTFTAICREACDLIVLDRAHYQEIMQEEIDRKLNEERNFLSTLPCLKGWTFKSVGELHERIPVRTFKRGNIVYNEDDEPDKMYIIKNGSFKVMKEIEIVRGDVDEITLDAKELKKDQKMKKIIDVALLGEKEIFGEDGLFTPEKRQYKIICSSLEAQVFEVNKKEFQRILKQHFPTRDWLESYSKSKKEFYEQRSQAVKDATKKHKHLLLFTKVQSSNTPQASPREQEDVSTLYKFNNFLPKSASSLSFRGGGLHTGEEETPLPIKHINYPQPKLLMKKLKKDLSVFADDTDMMNSWESRGESYRERKHPLSVWTEATGSRASTPNKKREGHKEDLKSIVSPHLESKFAHSRTTQNSPRFMISQVVSPKDKSHGLRSAGMSSEKFFFPKDFTTTLDHKESDHKSFIHHSKIKSLMNSQADFFTQPADSERFHTRASEIVSSISIKIEKSQSARFPMLQSQGSQPKILSSRLSPRQVKYLTTNDSTNMIDTVKGDLKEPYQLNLYTKAISETVSPRTDRLKDIQKGFNHVNWEQQRQKIKNIIEEKAGKEYRKYFYSIDGDFTASVKSKGDPNIALDQLKSENDQITSKKNPKNGVLKTVKYEHKKDTAIKRFDVSGKSLS